MTDSPQKILIGCFEVPGIGGTNTSTYNLFKQFRADGYDVHFVNIIGWRDEAYFQFSFGDNFGNPDNLPQVHNYITEGNLFSNQPGLADLIRKIKPDVIIGSGYIAAYLFKQAESTIPLIYLTGGSVQTKVYLQKGLFKDYTSLKKSLEIHGGMRVVHKQEGDAIKKADFIITHSASIRYITEKFFPSVSGKLLPDILWKASWVIKEPLGYQEYNKAFNDREIDILFVASDWDRKEKNYQLLKEIAAKCKKYNIHIVGQVEQDSETPHATHHGLLTERAQLFKLMGNCKAVVCPSAFDSAPGILYEASVMGCNLVASKNCGNWQICHEALLVDPYKLNIFTEKIRTALSEKFSDNLNFFLKDDPYKKLIEIISFI